MKCACGCGGEIIIKPHHSWSSIPKYIQGHNSKDNHPMKGKTHPLYKEKIIKKCKYCGKEYEVIPSNKNRKFCSNKCRGKWNSENRVGENNPNWKGKITLICEVCSKEYEVYPYNKNNRFCSKKCYSKWQSENIVGENHPAWNSNITDEERQSGRSYPEYNKWRETVKKRDNYMCQFCGLPIELNAHHIESYNNNPELRTTLSNGITMCNECHNDFHHQYGSGNNTKQQLIEFIKNKEENYNDKAA